MGRDWSVGPEIVQGLLPSGATTATVGHLKNPEGNIWEVSIIRVWHLFEETSPRLEHHTLHEGTKTLLSLCIISVVHVSVKSNFLKEDLKTNRRLGQGEKSWKSDWLTKNGQTRKGIRKELRDTHSATLFIKRNIGRGRTGEEYSSWDE